MSRFGEWELTTDAANYRNLSSDEEDHEDVCQYDLKLKSTMSASQYSGCEVDGDMSLGS